MIRGHSAVGDGLYESRRVAGQRSPLSPAQGLLVPAGGLRLPQVQVEVTVAIATADQGRVHAVSSAHWISAAISDVAGALLSFIPAHPVSHVPSAAPNQADFLPERVSYPFLPGLGTP